MLSSSPASAPSLTTNFAFFIAEFESKLKGRKPHQEALAELSTNQKLRDWYFGEPVQLGSDEKSIRAISLDGLDYIFKIFVSKRYYGIADDIWDLHKNFRKWIAGEAVNLGTQDNPILCSVSLSEVIANFKSFFAERRIRFLLEIWHINKKLQAWFAGKEVNFGTEINPDLRIISKDELLSTFKSALTTQRPELIKLLFYNNQLLTAWFSGRVVNFGTTTNLDLQTISTAELIESFLKVLSSHYSGLIIWMWENNSLLRAWFSGEKVNFGTLELPELRCIAADEARAMVKRVLASRCAKIKNELEGNKFFKKYFAELVNSDPNSLAHSEAIPLKTQIDNFKSVLSSHLHSLGLKIWNENELVRSTFCCTHVDITQLSADERTEILKNLSDNFKKVLASRNYIIISDMWQDPLLRDYFSGKTVNIGTDKLPDLRCISAEELLANFKAALYSRSVLVVESIWNEQLAEVIKQLKIKDPATFKKIYNMVYRSRRFPTLKQKLQSYVDPDEVLSAKRKAPNEFIENNPTKYSKTAVLIAEHFNPIETVNPQPDSIQQAFFEIDSYLSVNFTNTIENEIVQQPSLAKSKSTFFSSHNNLKQPVFDEFDLGLDEVNDDTLYPDLYKMY